MRRVALYAALTVVTVALLGLLLAVPFGDAPERRAILVSAIVAVLVQVPAFALVRSVRPAQTFSAWGVGALLRMLALLVYGVVVVRLVGLPPEAALISLATFFFVSTLLEPRLLSV